MDIPRYVLIAASLLLGLMLLGEWTRFSGAQQTAALPSVPMVAPYAVENNLSVAPAPTATPRQSDLPVTEDIDLSSSGGDANTISEGTNSDIGQHITVDTDTLKLMIDLRGGDVVGAALKNYPKTLSNSDDPFVLLERNAQRTYIAQSGIVGNNGIDNAQRASYQSERTVYQLGEEDSLEVALTYTGINDDLTVIKRFQFTRGVML